MKIRTMIQIAAFSVFLLTSLNVVSDSSDFLVEMRIIDAGVERATPSMLVKEGSEASMSLSGDNSVAVRVVVNSFSEIEAHVMAEIESVTNSISPELLVKKGEWASVSVGELEFHVRVQHHAANK
jgi:hypothetical protein